MFSSPDLPVTADALQNQIGPGVCGYGMGGDPIPCSDVFIARFDSNGAKVTYSTYLGGTSYEENAAIAVDSQGAVYVAGLTDSADFPVTADAFQPCSRAPGYPGNAFLAKFVPGGPLLYSTLLGGSGGASAAGVAVDDAGGIYVTGSLAPAGLLVPGYTDLYFPENDFPPQPVPLIVVGAGEPNGVFVGKIDTSSAAPTSRIGCIVNAASHLGGGVSLGEIVEILGTHIGPDQPLGAQFTSYGSISTSLGGVEVDFDGLAAPLLSARSDRIEAIVPYYPLEGDFVANVQVFYDGNATGVFPAVIQLAIPAVFSMDGSGQGQAAVLNEDGTLNSPSNRALKGSVVSIFCTGLGAVVNPPGDGTINSGGLPAPVGPVSVSIGGWPADVLFAGGAPGQVFGAFQVNARVPMQPAAGPAVPVLVLLDVPGVLPAVLGNAGPGVVTIAIE